MDDKYTVFRFLSQVFMIFGITTLLLNIICIIFGNDAVGYSTIFSLNSSGVSVETSLQFLLSVTILVVLRVVFMTDMLIKKMPLSARIVAMFISVFAEYVAFVFAFGWFPADNLTAWIMFIVCFVVSCLLSAGISAIAERQENRRLDEALQRIKEND